MPDTDGVDFVPALTGLGAPHWDPTPAALLMGLTRGTTRAHLARAALEAIAYEIQRRDRRPWRPESGLETPQLGGRRRVGNDLLCQTQADLLDVPVKRPQVVESTARGAAFLAGLATGVWSSHRRAGAKAPWRLSLEAR